jgi:hypothetical protein
MNPLYGYLNLLYMGSGEAHPGLKFYNPLKIKPLRRSFSSRFAGLAS